MLQIEKTVFISYRRTNIPWALAIYQYLTRYGYDVFFDYDSITSGDFEQVIIGNIKARAHFLVILTPSALERCKKPNDWLRREIETALDEKRNIVPVFLEGFDFGSPSISKYLTGKLEILKNYNGQNVPAGFFDEAMDKIRSKFLNIPLNAVLHPISPTVQKKVKIQQATASEAKPVQEKELSAQEWFEKGVKLSDSSEEEIHCYTEAIRLKPDYAEAYYNRGLARDDQGDFDSAIKDYTEAIHLKSDFAEPYNNRGNIRARKGDWDGAIQDFTRSIELKNPELHLPYNNRGIAKSEKGDLDEAITDYTETIRLKPDFADVYNNRGNTLAKKGNLDGAIKDYTKAISLEPGFVLAYRNRGTAWEEKGDFYSAIADYEKCLELGDKDLTISKRIEELKKK